jgi:hypothetical protein
MRERERGRRMGVRWRGGGGRCPLLDGAGVACEWWLRQHRRFGSLML